MISTTSSLDGALNMHVCYIPYIMSMYASVFQSIFKGVLKKEKKKSVRNHSLKTAFIKIKQKLMSNYHQLDVQISDKLRGSGKVNNIYNQNFKTMHNNLCANYTLHP